MSDNNQPRSLLIQSLTLIMILILAMNMWSLLAVHLVLSLVPINRPCYHQMHNYGTRQLLRRLTHYCQMALGRLYLYHQVKSQLDANGCSRSRDMQMVLLRDIKLDLWPRAFHKSLVWTTLRCLLPLSEWPQSEPSLH